MIRLIDDSTQYEMVFFYNSQWRRYIGMLRFPRGHPLFPLFIARVYEFKVCVVVTFESRKRTDPTKNIALEARACVSIRAEEFEHFTSDEQFEKLLERAEADAEDEAIRCIAEVFGIAHHEVAGTTYHFVCTERNNPYAIELVRSAGGCIEPDEYCSMARITKDGRLVKTKDYTEEWERVRG